MRFNTSRLQATTSRTRNHDLGVSTVPRKVNPTRPELLNLLEQTELQLWAMVGRWQDGIPAQVRAELMEIVTPILRALIRAGRR
jgi:hypothetical protein